MRAQLYLLTKSKYNILIDIRSCRVNHQSGLHTRGRHGRDRMVVGFTNTSVIYAYNH
jgi:hypothetical protein